MFSMDCIIERPIRRETFCQSSVLSRKTKSATAGMVSHAPSSISWSSWPGPQPEWPTKIFQLRIGSLHQGVEIGFRRREKQAGHNLNFGKRFVAMHGHQRAGHGTRPSKRAGYYGTAHRQPRATIPEHSCRWDGLTTTPNAPSSLCCTSRTTDLTKFGSIKC